MDGKELESVPEFCGRHSISRTMAYEEIKAGRLRPTKVGRRTLIARIDAEAWVSCVRSISRSAVHGSEN